MSHSFLSKTALTCLLTATLAPAANAEILDTPWSGGGTPITTVLSDGTTGPAEFNYNTPGQFSGSWSFNTVAADNRMVVLKYKYTGFHSYFRVTVGLNANFGANAYALVNDGPVNCCTPPSGGFSYNGFVAFSVQAGDTYGFSMTGTHFDGSYQLQGTLVVDELSKDDCKQGGWQTILDLSGDPLFNNQGDCVSFVATGGRNDPGQNLP